MKPAMSRPAIAVMKLRLTKLLTTFSPFAAHRSATSAANSDFAFRPTSESAKYRIARRKRFAVALSGIVWLSILHPWAGAARCPPRLRVTGFSATVILSVQRRRAYAFRCPGVIKGAHLCALRSSSRPPGWNASCRMAVAVKKETARSPGTRRMGGTTWTASGCARRQIHPRSRAPSLRQCHIATGCFRLERRTFSGRRRTP